MILMVCRYPVALTPRLILSCCVAERKILKFVYVKVSVRCVAERKILKFVYVKVSVRCT